MRSKSSSLRSRREHDDAVISNDDDVYMREMAAILDVEPMRGPPYEAVQLCCHVFIGSQRNANDVSYLRRLGVTHVLNCAGVRGVEQRRSPYLRDSGIEGYFVIPAEDYEVFDIGRYFCQTNEFLDEVRRLGGLALVHCNLGINRSGAVCTAYLMHSQHFPLLRVTHLLKSKRSLVLCNRGFRRQLVEYARRIGLLDPIGNAVKIANRVTFEDTSAMVTQRPLVLTSARLPTQDDVKSLRKSSNSLAANTTHKTDGNADHLIDSDVEQSKRRRLPSVQPDLDPIHEGVSLRSVVVGLLSKSATLPSKAKNGTEAKEISRQQQQRQEEPLLQHRQKPALQQEERKSEHQQQMQKKSGLQQQQEKSSRQQQPKSEMQQKQQQKVELQQHELELQKRAEHQHRPQQEQQRTHHRAVSAGAAPLAVNNQVVKVKAELEKQQAFHPVSNVFQAVQESDSALGIDGGVMPASTCRPLRVYRRSATDTRVYQRPQVAVTSNTYRRTETAPASSITETLEGMSVADMREGEEDSSGRPVQKIGRRDSDSKIRSQRSPFQRISSIGLFQRFMSEPSS